MVVGPFKESWMAVEFGLRSTVSQDYILLLYLPLRYIGSLARGPGATVTYVISQKN
jgi:hypothetical protein